MTNITFAKEPWCGTFLSLLLPGLGQIYAGRKRRGIFFICTILSLLIGFLIFCGWVIFVPYITMGFFTIGIAILLIVLGLVVCIFALFDAHRCVKLFNDENGLKLDVQRKKTPWLAVFLSYLLPGLGQLYNKQLVKGIFFFILIIVGVTLVSFSINFLLLEILVAMGIVYDAFNSAHTINNNRELFVKRLQDFFKKCRPVPGLLIVCLWILQVFPHDMLIGNHFLQTFKITVTSMSPTLSVGDRILVNKYIYNLQDPTRGEVVIFEPPEHDGESGKGKLFLKRIAGMPGERVEIRKGEIFIDGERLTDTKIFQRTYYHNRGEYGAEGKVVEVPKDHYYVLGDNSNNSKDSRYYGCMPRKAIKGKAYKIYYPFDRSGAIL